MKRRTCLLSNGEVPINYDHFSRMSTRDVIYQHYIRKIKEFLAGADDEATPYELRHSVQLIILEMEQEIGRNGTSPCANDGSASTSTEHSRTSTTGEVSSISDDQLIESLSRS